MGELFYYVLTGVSTDGAVRVEFEKGVEIR